MSLEAGPPTWVRPRTLRWPRNSAPVPVTYSPVHPGTHPAARKLTSRSPGRSQTQPHHAPGNGAAHPVWPSGPLPAPRTEVPEARLSARVPHRIHATQAPGNGPDEHGPQRTPGSSHITQPSPAQPTCGRRHHQPRKLTGKSLPAQSHLERLEDRFTDEMLRSSCKATTTREQANVASPRDTGKASATNSTKRTSLNCLANNSESPSPRTQGD